ncbi:SMP-30/gluconolactonase/LRE family protein [Nafulsella turpanensis]|uniref:hypothetical protein n=1 Tax=Nafulsella turpanensis TaxID=1265690 RepID=UPI0003468FB4|nr:hypothetical protein [Nafulsella turpanensis]
MKKYFLMLLGGAALLTACDGQRDANKNWTSGGEVTDEIIAQPEVSLEQVWATDAVLEVPESVLYNPEEEVLYVSNIVGEPTVEDGAGYISKISLDGEIIEKEWVSGLDAPKGMAILDGKLYVSDINELVEIDIAAGEILNRYAVEDASFLNDVIATADQKILFTDSDRGTVHQFADGVIDLWYGPEADERPNGLYAEEDRVLMATSGTGVFKEVTERGEGEVLAEGIGAGDGIAAVNENAYLVSNWQGEVYYVVEGIEGVEKILDTKEQKINAADIEFVRERDLLLVPTFFDNRVVAYKLIMGEAAEEEAEVVE